MLLKEFLEVCKDSNIMIHDRKNNPLIVGSKYADVFPYLICKVLDISTRGLDGLYITLDYLEGNNEEKSD